MNAQDRTSKVVYHAPRFRMVKLAAMAVLFVLGGLWMAGTFGDVPNSPSYIPPLLVVPIGWVGVVFFGACLIYFLYRFFSSTPTLLVDEQGFTDKASLSAVGRVTWDEVTSMEVVGPRRRRMLVVDVADRQALLERLKKRKARMVGASMSATGHPVNIPVVVLNATGEEVLTVMQRFKSAVEPGESEPRTAVQ